MPSLNTRFSKEVTVLRHAGISISRVFEGFLFWIWFALWFLRRETGSDLTVKYTFMTEIDHVVLIREEHSVSSA